MEDLLRPLDDRFWQAGQLADMDTVGTVCPAGDDLVQEDHLVIRLADGDIVITHPRQQL